MNITINSHKTNTTKLPNTAPSITAAAEASNRNGPGGGAVAQACAACKYQRRRCAPNCPLAPYFPADRQQDFLNVHKLFGRSNVVKILKDVPQPEKQNAMTSVIYEANMRAMDPVGGCHRIIRELEKKILHCRSEVDMVLNEVAFYRTQQLLKGEMANSNFYDPDTKGKQPIGVGNCILVHEGSISQVKRCSDEEAVKVETVEQFLNDKHVTEDMKPDVFEEKNECKKPNKSSANEVQKADDDSKKPEPH